MKHPDILRKKSQSLKWLLDTIIIEMSTKVKESHLTNCDQITTGLLVVVPLLETTCGNLLLVVSYAMVCQTKRWETLLKTESSDYQGRKERAEKMWRPFHLPGITCHPPGNS